MSGALLLKSCPVSVRIRGRNNSGDSKAGTEKQKGSMAVPGDVRKTMPLRPGTAVIAREENG